MIKKILDLHIHSKYSRACSRDLTLPNIAKACETRGIDIVVTGDFTHPKWMEHIEEWLVEERQGLYKLKDNSSKTRFLLGTEVASIKKHNDVTRRVHLLLFAPSIAVAKQFNAAMEDRGLNIHSDGRPILGMTCKDILKTMLDIDPRMVMIPAHAWTPWFGVFGSKGGYTTLEEAFEELTPHVRAIETGLSSDPLMNGRWSKLDNITLISNSDAHSTAKLGREANVLQFENEEEITYDEIMHVIQEGDAKKFLYTIEFYPEEGKYHYDGHAVCKFSCPPEETKKYGGLCPVCKKQMTIGVMNRVAELADRTEQQSKRNIPHKSLVPLPEIIADALETGVTSKKVKKEYDALIQALGSEFFILINASIAEIEQVSGKIITHAVDRVRKGNIVVIPGYDGIFGVVKVFQEHEPRGGVKQTTLELE